MLCNSLCSDAVAPMCLLNPIWDSGDLETSSAPGYAFAELVKTQPLAHLGPVQVPSACPGCCKIARRHFFFALPLLPACASTGQQERLGKVGGKEVRKHSGAGRGWAEDRPGAGMRERSRHEGEGRHEGEEQVAGLRLCWSLASVPGKGGETRDLHLKHSRVLVFFQYCGSNPDCGFSA